MAEGYTVLVKKPSDVSVGDKVRLVSVGTSKVAKMIAAKDDVYIVDVTAVGEKTVTTPMKTVTFPNRAEAGFKVKLYRKSKPRGRTAKKKEGGIRRKTLRK